MIVTIFRSRLRAGVDQAYSEMAARMERLASEMPGFVSIKNFCAEDGERVSVVEFESTMSEEMFHASHRFDVANVESNGHADHFWETLLAFLLGVDCAAR